MLFVSPSPEASSGRPPQLYARVDGAKTVLISDQELAKAVIRVTAEDFHAFLSKQKG